MAFAQRHRWVLVTLLALLGAVIVLQALDGGVSDPTADVRLSTGAVIFDSGLLVFREGLESILVLAAVVASLVGINGSLRRPIGVGAGAGLVATAATWILAAALLGHLGDGGLQIQAITGLVAIMVLLVVMNWFFHKVYWTGWISHQNRRKRELMSLEGPGAERRVFIGLAVLGFFSVYREGFEIVLFLQNMRLQYGQATVLQGVALAAVLVAIVAAATFLNHARLPYKRMLIVTGVMLGIVLVVMVGEQVQEMQAAGWIGTTPIGFGVPGWMGTWLAVFPNVEGLVAQAGAVALALGSYFWAEEARVRRPRRRGEATARRLAYPPASAEEGAVSG
jgi:high-affinity iron transporter